MDVIHDAIADALHPVLPQVFNKGQLTSQMLIYYLMLCVGGFLAYITFASLSFFFFFHLRGAKYYPKTIPRAKLWQQVRHEIRITLTSLPFMAILMLPFPVLSHRGYSRVYRSVDDYGWPYLVASVPLFIAFTDMLIYFVHLGLHHHLVYKHIHKLHHTYRWTTPFSSHAFHPVDGFAQGVPYYIFLFLFPLHHKLFVCLFLFVNFWTISIHDQVDFGVFNTILNSTDHHTIHHVEFKYNYGQYFTVWDRICGTHKQAKKTHSLWQ
eukprot:TRINITY_DN11687_c0_g1_i1.p2 TRINITY_DN11687_c0_g1~~TRINITY_DN11687_c0_g1_i1.p2  ORF type:complete len:279 (+),score=87.20 TRINITY_DN11687_c0_g1_i1:40-837(+)